MKTSVLPLAKFLNARASETLQEGRDIQARQAIHNHAGSDEFVRGEHLVRTAVAISRFVALYAEAADPARSEQYAAAHDYMESTGLALANIYADHPDFREEWLQ